MPYRTSALPRWTRLAVHRATWLWQAPLLLGAVVCVCLLVFVDGPGIVALVSMALPVWIALLIHVRRDRVEIYREGVRVRGREVLEVRWDDVTTLHCVITRNSRNHGREAGWALDTRDGRRLRIGPWFGALEPALLNHLSRDRVQIRRTDEDRLPDLAGVRAPGVAQDRAERA